MSLFLTHVRIYFNMRAGPAIHRRRSGKVHSENSRPARPDARGSESEAYSSRPWPKESRPLCPSEAACRPVSRGSPRPGGVESQLSKRAAVDDRRSRRTSTPLPPWACTALGKRGHFAPPGRLIRLRPMAPTRRSAIETSSLATAFRAGRLRHTSRAARARSRISSSLPTVPTRGSANRLLGTKWIDFGPRRNPHCSSMPLPEDNLGTRSSSYWMEVRMLYQTVHQRQTTSS